MAFPKNNMQNRVELATCVVDTWSLEDLKEYVISQFEADYRMAPDIFEDTWDDYKDSFDWSIDLLESVKKKCPNPGCFCGACDRKQ